MTQKIAIRILLAVILITGGFALGVWFFSEYRIDICSLFCQFQPTEAAWWDCVQECVAQ